MDRRSKSSDSYYVSMDPEWIGLGSAIQIFRFILCFYGSGLDRAWIGDPHLRIHIMFMDLAWIGDASASDSCNVFMDRCKNNNLCCRRNSSQSVVRTSYITAKHSKESEPSTNKSAANHLINQH